MERQAERTLSIYVATIAILFAASSGIFANDDVVIEVPWEPLTAEGLEIENGDANASGDIDIADVSYLIRALFLGGTDPVQPMCEPDTDDGVGGAAWAEHYRGFVPREEPTPSDNADDPVEPSGDPSQSSSQEPFFVPTYSNGDSNGDGTVDLSDALHLVGFLFLGRERPIDIVCKLNLNA
jgi:hypothetical protein